MDNFEIKQTDEGLHVEGFPDAVKLLKIEGENAKRIADLALHKVDLDFSADCLAAINETPDSQLVVRSALWKSAIVHFIKCFGNSAARFRLKKETIYSDKPSEAMEAFDFFRHIRNKNVVHDENSYSQSIPGAVLNNGDKPYKIDKILCFSAEGDSLSQENYGNLKLLIDTAYSWVVKEFDECCNIATKELENVPYDDLLQRNNIEYRFPAVSEVHRKRQP